MANDDTVIAITVNGVEHSITFEECTAVDARECRKQTGLSLREIFGAVGGGQPDLDSVAAIVWLSRRKRGERDLSYDAVASTISYGTQVDGASGGDVSEQLEDSYDPE